MHKSRVILILVGLILVAFLGTAYAGYFGAPQPMALENSGSVGIGYFFHQNTWKANNATREVKQNEIYAQFSAATKYLETYLRLGGADLKVDNAFPSGDSFKDSGRVFGTIGLRTILEITPYLGVGPFLQASIFDDFQDSSRGETITFKKPWEIAGGAALQGKIGDFIVYAGPYLYWSQAKDESTDSHIESKNNFGGMAGVRIPIGKRFNVEAECQYLDKVSAGAQFSYSF